MMRFRSILVATDFSLAATHAVRRAVLAARRHGARLSLLHAIDPAGCTALRRLFARDIDLPLKLEQTRASLARMAGEIRGRYGVETDAHAVAGDAFEEIFRASERADLVVLGHRASPSLRDLVPGGTAERLLRTCRKPVLVVKGTPAERPYRRVLVPMDFTACSHDALALAAGLGDDGLIHAFHARDAGETMPLQLADVPAHEIRERRELADEATRSRMHEWAADLGIAPGRLVACVGQGDAGYATLQEADAIEADVIVAGKQGRSTLAGFLLGSVTRRLVAHARCDVLVVPRAAARAERAPAWRARAASRSPASRPSLHCVPGRLS